MKKTISRLDIEAHWNVDHDACGYSEMYPEARELGMQVPGVHEDLPPLFRELAGHIAAGLEAWEYELGDQTFATEPKLHSISLHLHDDRMRLHYAAHHHFPAGYYVVEPCKDVDFPAAAAHLAPRFRDFHTRRRTERKLAPVTKD